jgi:hypothetical protein
MIVAHRFYFCSPEPAEYDQQDEVILAWNPPTPELVSQLLSKLPNAMQEKSYRFCIRCLSGNEVLSRADLAQLHRHYH